MEERNVPTPTWLTLARGERVQFRTQPSANLLLAIIVVGFVVLVLGSMPFAYLEMAELGYRVSLLIIAGVMMATLVGFMVIRGREYVMTTERVCRAVGPTSKRVTTVDLDRVDDVVLEQPAWQRWLGVGTLTFVTDDDSLHFELVENPQFVYERALDNL